MANSYSYIQEYDENGIFIKPEDRHTTLVFHSLTAKENYIKEEKKKRKTCRKARKAQAKAQQAKAQTKNDTHPSPSFAERQAEKWEEIAAIRSQRAKNALQAGLSRIFDNVDPPSVSGGSEATQVWGVVVPQMITNSRWFQEGVSLWNSNAELKVALDKAEKCLFHLDTQEEWIKKAVGYPDKGRADVPGYLRAKEAFKQLICEDVEAQLGKTFRYKEVIYSGFGAKLRHRRLNQPLKLGRVTMVDNPFDIGAVESHLKFSLELSSGWKKIRGYGLKSTLVDTACVNLAVDGETKEKDKDWVVMHTMSGLKGKPLDLVAFAHSVGGATLNVRTGTISPSEGPLAGKHFDVTRQNSVVDKWRNAVTRTRTLSFDYAKAEWEFIRKADKAEGCGEIGSNQYDVKRVEAVDEDTVRITAKVECFVAEMPLNIEVSLPEEGSGRTQLTAEMLSSICLQNRLIGEEMIKLGSEKRKSILNLLAMYQGKAPKNAPVVRLQEESVLERLAKIVPANADDAAVLRAYAKTFPEGAVFRTRNNNQVSGYLDFNAIMGISTFIGGSGDGVSHTLVQFLRGLPEWLKQAGRDSKIHQQWALTYQSSRAWFLAQLEAKGLRKKLTNGLKGTAFGSKVRTVALPELNHQGEIPDVLFKIGINPEDDLLLEMARSPYDGRIPFRFSKTIAASEKLNGRVHVGWLVEDKTGNLQHVYDLEKGSKRVGRLVFDPQQMEGEYATVFRTPMICHGAGELVVTPKVAVGHCGLLMHIWAALNEGDSDGDSIGIVPAFHYLDHRNVPATERYAMMVAMNNHPMGMTGYLEAYGPLIGDWPCAEFCSHNDAWSKKRLHVVPGSKVEQKLVEKGILPYIRRVPVRDWVDTVGNVSAHYRNNVSKAYNIAVVAVNRALEFQYRSWERENTGENMEEQLQTALQTSAIAWRLIYEGLGLAGFSEDANKWFQLFNIAGYATYYRQGPTKLEPVFQKEEGCKSVARGLAQGAGFVDNPNARSIAMELIRISRILRDIQTLEAPAKYAKRWQALLASKSRFTAAVVARAQRLCSQGTDEALKSQIALMGQADDGLDESEAGLPEANSAMDMFLVGKLYKGLSCRWQAVLLKQAAEFTTDSIRMVSAAANAAQSQEEF